MNFEVFRKRGRGWQLLGVWMAKDSRQAAMLAGHIHNCKVLGVRPEYSNAKLFVHRFTYVPSLTATSGAGK